MAVKAGTFVSWRASKGEAKGRVMSVHTKSKVPAVATHAEGSMARPVARVRVYAPSGNGWAATATFVPIAVDDLTAVDPLPESTTEATVMGSDTISFNDIRDLVSDAIADGIEEMTGQSPDLYVVDIGVDWAIYTIWSSECDYWLVGYSYDPAANSVMLTGPPVEVTRKTTWVPDVDGDDGPTATGEATKVRMFGRLLGAKTATGAGGRVFGVQIIEPGDSKNRRVYPPGVLAEATKLYEGAKAYDRHRDDAELSSSTIQGLVGTYRNVSVAPSGALEADLHLLPSATHAAEALDLALSNQADGLPPLVGISHDVMARFGPIPGRPGWVECTQVVSVNSADIVADPAAGGQATRMVAGGFNPNPSEEDGMSLTKLLEGASDEDKAALRNLLGAPDPKPATEAAPVAPVAYDRAGLFGRSLIRSAVDEAGLPAKVAESLVLPASFTEADLSGEIERVKSYREGLELDDLTPKVPAVKVTQESRDKWGERMDATLAGDYRNGWRSLKAAYVAISGVNPYAESFESEDFNRRILRESGAYTTREGGPGFYDSQRASESVSSSTWNTILGDSITRRMVAEYNQPNLQTWRSVVSSIVPINDFRTQRVERMGGYGTLPAVAQGAPYQALTSAGNEEVTYSISKRGGTEDLTIETIANDDLGAVQRIPRKLGLAAAQTLYRFVWDTFPTNGNLYDSTALFAAGHTNTDTTAMSGAAVSVGRKKMRKQAAYGDTSDVLSITPRMLIVCSDLEELAFEITTSAVAMPSGAPTGAATNIPNIHAGLELITVDYWSSTTAWFLVADPNMVPTFELGFYQGRQDPDLFVQNDPQVGSVFTSDKVTWKIRHIYSGAVLDYRGFYRGNA